MLLSDLLTQYCIDKPEFLRLFNISERTYQRWNKQPPAHIVELLRLINQHSPRRPECWNNWFYDRHFLVDPEGNEYSINEIRAIFWNRQLIESLTGTTSNIASLKKHLETRLKAQPAHINISLNDQHCTIKEWKIQL